MGILILVIVTVLLGQSCGPVGTIGAEADYTPRYNQGYEATDDGRDANQQIDSSKSQQQDKKKSSDKSSDRDNRSSFGDDKDSYRESDDRDDRDRDSDEDEPQLASDDDKEEKPISYPRLLFRGSGHTTYERKDKLRTTMGIQTRMDDYELELSTIEARIFCGDKGGCKQGEVDEDVRKDMIGRQVYDRTSKSDLQDLARRDRNPTVIFADSVTDKKGRSTSFHSSIPVYPWPSRMGAYEDQGFGTQTWQSQYSHEGRTRPMTVTVNTEKLDSTDVRVTISLNLPQDDEHKHYENLPMLKRAIYTIDTKRRNIRQFQMVSYFHGDKSKDPEEMIINHRLCEKVQDGDRKSFSCN